MANCNQPQCKNLLAKLAKIQARVLRRKERLNYALGALGFGGTLTAGVIFVWLTKKLAEATAAVAFPGIGWVFAAATLAALIAAMVLYKLYRDAVNERDTLCKQAFEACDVECLPAYCR